MNKAINHRLSVRIGLVCLCLASMAVWAQVNPRVGTVLGSSELATLRTQAQVSTGGQKVRVLSSATPQVQSSGGASNTVTLVVNEDGVIGQSENVVVISRIPVSQVQTLAAKWVAQAVSVQYYDHMDMTLLRFGNFSEAAAARTAIERALPEAGVSLPIQYTPRKAN